MSANTTATGATATATSVSASASASATVVTSVSSVPVVTAVPSTVTVTSSDATTTATATLVTSTSIITLSPSSTVYVQPSTANTSPTVVTEVTSTIIENPATTGGTQGPTIVTITSTQAPVTITPSVSASASRTSAATSSASALTASSSGNNSGSGGLSSGATIAIAVIIPVVVIALGFFLGLFLWRKRKARKNAEEERKNEMAEYGFNPNHDPTFPPVVGAAAYTEGASEAADESGYRGWGTTSNTRKASTTLGSNSRAAAVAGMAYSDTGSQPGGSGFQQTPSNGTGQGSDQYSGEHLINNHPEGAETIGALGGATAGMAAGAASRHRNSNTSGIQRGPSNASSAYSNGRAASESSIDAPAVPGPYYHEEVPYNIYNDVSPQHGPYGDGSYGGTNEPPVIRDVQARRNPRIERAPTFPQTQGGIAQNF